MLAILFPHMFEDVEYLIPPDLEGQHPDVPSSSNKSTLSTRRVVHINAEAGPSRLPL